MQKKSIYYIIATIVVFIWSTTFISTKTLLKSLSPVEIMFYRYIIAYVVLWIAHPKLYKAESVKEELLFLGAGIFGGTIYFLTENYALKYTLASNVGLLVAAAPMFTAITAYFFVKGEKLGKGIYLGFIAAFLGTFLVVFNGHFVLKLNPLGDVLAIGAALSWAFYSVLIKKIGTRYNGIYITRKIFFYSILTMLPVLFVTDFRWDLAILYDVTIIGNLLFLGILASSICFLLWSKVIWEMGAVRANNFIYLVPLITMILSAFALDEKITVFAAVGGLFIVMGVYFADHGEDILNKLPKYKQVVYIGKEEE